MSADRERDHLDFMTDQIDTHYSPGQYATTPEQEQEADQLHQALAAAHAQLYVTTVGAIQVRR